MTLFSKIRPALIGLSFLLVLAACSSVLPAPPTAAPPTPAVTEAPLPTDTPELTPTPTALPSRVVLLAPAEANPELRAAVETQLAALAGADGLLFEAVQNLSPADLGPETRLVVALPPDPGLQSLAAGAPQTQFLALGLPGLESAANLSVIGAEGERADQQGFLAGYLASVVTADWRVGVISLEDTAAGQGARQGFLKGVVFYCGLCRPAFPPFVQYPVYYELPSGAGVEAQQAAAAYMTANAVKTVYVFPGAGDAALLEALAAAEINLIGGTPPPAGLHSRWIASIRPDWAAGVAELWPALLQGQGGATQPAPLQLTDLNENLFSAGRQRVVQELLADLVAGYIDTGVDPQTGQLRP